MKKRGQVTIFIVVGIVVVVGVLAVLFLRGGVEIVPQVREDPREMVQSCVEDLVEESLAEVVLNGGEVLPSLAISYQGNEWNYLCYNGDYYLSCYNLHPMLEAEVEAEVEADTSEDVQGCFNLMRSEFEDRGYDVGGGSTNYSVDLLPGFVKVSLEKDISVSNGESSYVYDDFGFEMGSEAYGLIGVSRLIANDESQFCNFEYNGYMLLYPGFDIRRIDYKDSKLYRVIDRRSGEEFRFAVRSCALPPGI